MPKKKTLDEFIQEANIIHNNKYDYTKTNYINSKTKIIVICSTHGEFKICPSHHINSRSGCQKCSGNHRYTTEEYINEAKIIHGEYIDYSKVNYINAHTEIILICHVHGEFRIKPYNHLQRLNPCSQCTDFRGSKGKTYEEFINKAKLIHGTNYNYSKSKNDFINFKSTVTIICPTHGDFLQKVDIHLGGSGCQTCSNEKNPYIAGSYEEFLKRSIETHGKTYDYSKSKSDFINFKSNVTIICPTHGEFIQEAGNHFRGNGCKNCSKYTRIITKDIFINECNQIHNNKYDYSKVNYTNTKAKIEIICPIHGSFIQLASNHLHGQGCRNCNQNTKVVDTKIFIDESNKIHNNKYDYSKVNYITNKINVDIICPKHGLFNMSPAQHKKGSGCVSCNSYSPSSIKALSWLMYISISEDIVYYENSINKREYTINNSRYNVDGFCEKKNTVYEFHGDYWHGNPRKYRSNDINPTTKTTYGELYEKTKKKEEFIINERYIYKCMWEMDWDNAIKIVKKSQRLWKKKLPKIICIDCED